MENDEILWLNGRLFRRLSLVGLKVSMLWATFWRARTLALSPWSLLLWATAWWALNLSFEALKLVVLGHYLVGFELELWSLQACCCGLLFGGFWTLILMPLKLVGLNLWILWACGLDPLKLVGLSLKLVGLYLWSLWACGLDPLKLVSSILWLWSLWDCTIETCGLVPCLLMILNLKYL